MEAWTRRHYTEQMDTHYPGASSSTHIDSSMGNTKGLSRVLGTIHSHCFCGGALICALQKQSHQPFWNMQNLPDVSTCTSLSETDVLNKASCALFTHDPQVKTTAHRLKRSILSSTCRSDLTKWLLCVVYTGWMWWDAADCVQGQKHFACLVRLLQFTLRPPHPSWFSREGSSGEFPWTWHIGKACPFSSL